METKLAHVDLASIVVSESNKMFRDETEISAEGLRDLIESVKQKGVIQPILLRPKDKKYELVCGERRYRASVFADLKTIPAYIRELDDKEAFELQVTENLQRKDVHPLREAHAYKYLHDADPEKNSPQELALRFGKSIPYVMQRLKLNDLVAEAKKDFQEGKMQLGHALIIARLTPQDQRETMQHCVSIYNKEKHYDTVKSLEEFVNDNVICNLSSVAFKKDDETLVPKAGPCTTCPKRSGANQLFADINEKDRCFDPACFIKKRIQHTANQVVLLAEQKPDIVFLKYKYGNARIPEAIEKVLKERGIKPLEDYETYNLGGAKKIHGIWVSGDKIGKEDVVYDHSTKEKKPGKAGQQKTDVTADIARIKERMKRAIELDDEKIFERVLTEAKKNEALQLKSSIKSSNTDLAMLLKIVFNSAPYQLKEVFRKKLGLQLQKDETKAIQKLGQEELLYMVRNIMIEQYSSAYNVKTTEGDLIMLAAQEWGIAVNAFRKEQEEIRIKREARAKERINALKAEANKSPGKAKKKKAKLAKEPG